MIDKNYQKELDWKQKYNSDLAEFRKKAYKLDNLMPKRYCLVLTNLCNLACDFCYQIRTKQKNSLNSKDWIKLIKELGKIVKISYFKTIISNNFFSNKSIVFSGTLTKLSRDEAKYKAKTMGAKILSTVSKNTDYVVIGEKAGSKLKKAQDLGIKILYENEFLKKVNE